MAKKKEGHINFYEQWEHDLQTAMIHASPLPTDEARKFVTETFLRLFHAYEEKAMNQPAYIRLVNRLASFQHGTFNDYLHVLVGSAELGTLNDTLEKGKYTDLASLARSRSMAATMLTGFLPVIPEQEE